MDKVKDHFLRSVSKGRVKNAKELLAYAERKKLAGVSLSELRKLRQRWKWSGVFHKVREPSTYMGTSKFRYGHCQIDLAFMKKSLRSDNQNCWAFIVCVEVSTLQIALEPVQNKTKKAWNEGISRIVESGKIGKIRTLYSDKERALTSAETVENLRNKYGIKMVFLKARNKAYYAELFISIVKRMLGLAMSKARKSKDPLATNWIRFLGPINEHLNNRLVPGTSMKRGSVNDENFIDMKNQLENNQAYSNMSLNYVEGGSLRQAPWKKKIFKYKLGSRVLVDYRALVGIEKKKTFQKNSFTGGYSGKVFVVEASRLQASKNLDYVPVYKIRQLHKRAWETGWFYQAELAPLDKRAEDEPWTAMR